jgi:hypothetical protein
MQLRVLLLFHRIRIAKDKNSSEESEFKRNFGGNIGKN